MINKKKPPSIIIRNKTFLEAKNQIVLVKLDKKTRVVLAILFA